MSKRTVQFNIYRYDPNQDDAPRFQEISVELEESDKKLLDALVRLKTVDDSFSFRRSCREGVCGSDAMNINGKNGLACLLGFCERHDSSKTENASLIETGFKTQRMKPDTVGLCTDSTSNTEQIYFYFNQKQILIYFQPK